MINEPSRQKNDEEKYLRIYIEEGILIKMKKIPKKYNNIS